MNTEHSSTTQDQHSCPLCGGDNRCARAADPAATDCWCNAETFSPQLLASVPAEAKHRRCICPACVARANQSDPSAD